jgi:hypothetical protein
MFDEMKSLFNNRMDKIEILLQNAMDAIDVVRTTALSDINGNASLESYTALSLYLVSH